MSSTRKLALALVVAAFTPALVGPGCGGSSSTGGKGGKDGGAAGTLGVAGSAAGTSVAGSTAGTSVAGTTGTDAAAGTTNVNPDAAMDMAPGVDLTHAPPDGGQGISWLFDTTTQGWIFAKYGSTPNGMPDAPANLAHTSVMAWNATNDADNKTTSGSLQGTVPFTMANERIDFQAFSNGAGMYDWFGYKVTAKVKLVSGGNLANGCPLSAVIYISGPSTQNYMTTVSPAVDLVKGSWVTVTYDAADAAVGGVDITLVSQTGLQISTGSTCVGTTPDGGTDGGADGGTDAVVAEAGHDAAVDAGTDLLVDAGLGDVIDAVASDATAADATDAVVDATPPPPPTATTAVILIDSVVVSVK